MTVYFSNKEAIDLNAIAIQGVSVKGEGSIGYFGTGLKFSIATLLRTGHKVTLYRNNATEVIEFKVVDETIRGEVFNRVTMGGEKLGFTTMLGRNWEVWQAYRELYSNTLDEKGEISTTLPLALNDAILLGSDYHMGTIFAIEGEAFEQCHRDRGTIFLQSEPVKLNYTDCHIHRGSNDFAFYRTIRARKLIAPSVFTYDVRAFSELTEDRTIKNESMCDHYIINATIRLDDEEIIHEILKADRSNFEGHFNYYHANVKPSVAWMNVMHRLQNDMKVNPSAHALFLKHRVREEAYQTIDLDSIDRQTVSQALLLIGRLGKTIDESQFEIVESLGNGVFGAVKLGKVLIARTTLDRGVRFLASTLYEEFLHRDDNISDESRAMQDLLLDKLFAMTSRVLAMEMKTLPPGMEKWIGASEPEVTQRNVVKPSQPPARPAQNDGDDIPF